MMIDDKLDYTTRARRSRRSFSFALGGFGTNNEQCTHNTSIWRIFTTRRLLERGLKLVAVI